MHKPGTYLKFRDTVIKIITNDEYFENKGKAKGTEIMPFQVIKTGDWLGSDIHPIGSYGAYGAWGDYWEVAHGYNTPLYKVLNG